MKAFVVCAALLLCGAEAGLFSDMKDGLDEPGEKWNENTQLCKPGDPSCIEESVFSDAAYKQKIMGPFFWPVPQTQATSKCVPIKMTGRYNSAWLESGQLVGKSECSDTACTTDCRETYRTGLDDDECLGPFDAGKGAYYLKFGQSKEKRDWTRRDWKDHRDHHHKDNKCLEDKGRGMQPDDDCCAIKGTASCADGYTLVESEETCCSWCSWKPLKYSCIAPTKDAAATVPRTRGSS